ncbi:TetR/AcrR family transcriptional regulator [Nocardia sp. CA-135953]|uniref:TetR/AcrR family transcriptional regulator n=1 Tax=Nocardia sp. CA-135953 TaxID=3239978 RepID=UPI003D95CBD3
MPTSAEGSAPRQASKRRTRTRQRILDAAFETFAEAGFGNSTVEQVCERAGFTRGAFYSNFVSLEELFLAMWEQRSAQMLANVKAILDTDCPTVIGDTRQTVARSLAAIPLDDKWFRISSEFTAHALRRPTLQPIIVAHEQAIMTTMMLVVEKLINRVGRAVTDRDGLGRALAAVHDGTSLQILMDPSNPAIHQHRIDLFAHVLVAYTHVTSDTGGTDV